MAKIGELAALCTAVFWTVTAVSFEYAGKRVGALSLNLIRLVIGFLFLGVFSLVSRGFFIPVDAGATTWIWLGLSGLVGFVIGDLLLFRAFIEIGARISMLIYASVPPLAAVMGRLFLGESLTLLNIAAMAVTISGITLVVLKRAGGEETRRLRFAHPLRGVALAFGGALGQAVGLILSKIGAPSYNAFSATQIRVIAGIAGFVLVILSARRSRALISAIKDGPALRGMVIGAFFGPFLGVSLGLVALQHTSAGIASTIMAITPVLIIVPSVLIFRERVSLREVLGAVIAVAGVAFLFFG
jgi:drug/metabolite transporter (DMT)-like permease